MSYKIFFLLSLIFLSCNTKLEFNQDIEIEELSLCLNYHPSVDSLFIHEIDSLAVLTLDSFNLKENPFRVNFCMNKDTSLMFYNININFTSTASQITSLFVSTVGLTVVPIMMYGAKMPYIIYFYYWDREYIIGSMDLSNSISKPEKPRKFESESFTFFRTFETKKKYLYEKFQNQLKQELYALRREYIDRFEDFKLKKRSKRRYTK